MSAGKPCIVESKSVSRILYSDFRFEVSDLKAQTEIETAIIPLAQPLPVGSSDLPGGLRRAARLKSQIEIPVPPYLVLHREEFAWPRMSPHAPVRSYF